jgi:hypothetical protein
VDIITQIDKLGLISLKVAKVPTSFWGGEMKVLPLEPD